MNNQGNYLTLSDNGAIANYSDIYWDNPASMYNTWGYKSWINRPDVDKQVNTQLNRLFSTVSHGGVFLLNIGPDGNGNIIDYEKEVLTKISDFLDRHPDTLDKIKIQYQEKKEIEETNKKFILTNNNCMIHSAIDGTGYISTQIDSWRSWNINVSQERFYDIFIVYLPENEDKNIFSFVKMKALLIPCRVLTE